MTARLTRRTPPPSKLQMFVYGFRCNPEAVPIVCDYIQDARILALSRFTRPSVLRNHGGRLTAEFREQLDRLTRRADSVWEIDWLEHPYLDDAEGVVAAEIRAQTGLQPSWFHVPDRQRVPPRQEAAAMVLSRADCRCSCGR